MQNLSYWGMMNPLKAQFIIVFAQILFCLLATYSGIWLFTQDILLTNSLYYTGFGLFFITFALYPVKRSRFRFWKHTFAKQMGMSSLLMVSYLMIALTISNREARIASQTRTSAPQNVSIALKSGIQTAIIAPKTTLKARLKQKYATYVLKNRKNASMDTGSIVGIIAIILLMILCLLGVAALACNVSCSGSSSMGIVVLVGGTAFVLWGGILVIRSLLKRPNNYQPMPN
jgi:hypothetical protein